MFLESVAATEGDGRDEDTNETVFGGVGVDKVVLAVMAVELAPAALLERVPSRLDAAPPEGLAAFCCRTALDLRGRFGRGLLIQLVFLKFCEFGAAFLTTADVTGAFVLVRMNLG